MKYLVTGGAGFIGSHLVELLQAHHFPVVVIDNLMTGRRENLPSPSPLCSFINRSIEEISYQELQGITGIFHLAAQASVPVSIEHFYESSVNNLQGSIKALEWAKKLKVPLVYASSSAVYGDLECGSDLIDNFHLQSPYALDKLVLEQYAKLAHTLYDTSSIGLRFFNVYGPRQDPSNPYSGVISIFTDRLTREEPVTVNGGYQTRDFIYVRDVAQILKKAMDFLCENSMCEIVNVGTGISVTIDALLEVLAGILKIRPDVLRRPLPGGDPVRSRGDYRKLVEVLGVNLSELTSLSDGLLKTINYDREVAV